MMLLVLTSLSFTLFYIAWLYIRIRWWVIFLLLLVGLTRNKISSKRFY